MGALVALEPSEPTRAARRRLRLAAAGRAAIYHPNLVRAWPIGEGDGRLLIAFERCPHPTLAELLTDLPLGPTECARILDGAVAGVDALNERALVARDLTPERLLVHPERGGMLMDLGIPPDLLRPVPVEQDPELAFRSPEELERKPVDLRSSVYSLGAMLFTALTGRPPGNYSAGMAEARLRPSDRQIELSPEIDAVVARALARDPAERYANPEALLCAVAGAVGADLAPKGVISSRNGRRQQGLPERPAASTQRNGGRPATASRKNDLPMPPREQTHRQTDPTAIPPWPPQAEPRPASRPAHGVVAHFPAAARRCVAAIVTLLALTVIRAGVAAAATRRGVKVGWVLFLRGCRLVMEGVRRGAVAAAVAGSRAHRTLIRLKRSRPSVAQDPGGRIDRFAHDSGTVAPKLAFGSERGRRRGRLPATMTAASRCVPMMATLLALAGSTARRGQARVRQLAGVVGPMVSSAASIAATATRRGAKVISTLFLRVCRLVVVAARRGAVVAAVAARRARRALIHLKRAAPSVAQGAGRRIDRFARDGAKLASRLVRSGTAAAKRAFGLGRGLGSGRRPEAIRTAVQRSFRHSKPLLPALAAIVLSALSGIALWHAFESEEGPSSVSRSGLSTQLPRGWEPADLDPGLPTLSSAIAAAPSGEAGAGFLAGKLSSLAAGERMLERVQRDSDGRTQVQLGGLNAWQYAGLRPLPRRVGTGYLIPTGDAAVLVMCHASVDTAPVRLAECRRAATMLVIRGERPLPLSSVDRSNERMIRIFATLRSSRSEGRGRLEAAELARGQARAATSLQLSHKRAAGSLDRISALENGYSLENLSAALRAAAAAYGRLADAAAVSSRSTYRQARHAVVRAEKTLRRELARTRNP